MDWPKKITLYLHSSKENNYNKGEALGLKEEALHNFQYALYEVEFDLLVYEDGSTMIEKIRYGKEILP